jgi:hypothetical protein
LITRVKHVVLGDWFWEQNMVFKDEIWFSKGGNVNPIF